MKTYIAKTDEIEKARQWFVINAEDQILGRMASQIASVLKGKNKPFYSPHQDGGDFRCGFGGFIAGERRRAHVSGELIDDDGIGREVRLEQVPQFLLR